MARGFSKGRQASPKEPATLDFEQPWRPWGVSVEVMGSRTNSVLSIPPVYEPPAVGDRRGYGRRRGRRRRVLVGKLSDDELARREPIERQYGSPLSCLGGA